MSMADVLEDALKDLASESPHLRLKAARVLARHGSSACVPVIRKALRRETVSWVRRALETALARQAPKGATTPADERSESTKRDIKSAAVHEVTRILLHEFEPVIGVLKIRAMREVRDYAESDVHKSLEHLDLLISAIRTMSQAAATPTQTEFELASFIKEIADEYINAPTISLVGPSPLLVDADRGKLRMALSNGLRNAIEAVSSIAEVGTSSAIVVHWGATDIDVWIAVTDDGPGFSGSPAAVFDVGSSTKDGHLGMGLAIVKQAMDSIEGTVALTSSPSGSRFEIRWYKGRTP